MGGVTAFPGDKGQQIKVTNTSKAGDGTPSKNKTSRLHQMKTGPCFYAYPDIEAHQDALDYLYAVTTGLTPWKAKI